MNPHAHPTPGLHLPQPSGPAVPLQPAGIPQADMHLMGQQGAPMPQSQHNHGAYPQTAPVPPQLAPAPVPASTLSPVSTATEMSDEQQDEEWISKAKEIVDRNRTDPFAQSRELGELKAQYLKLRYNKDIKAGKDQT